MTQVVVPIWVWPMLNTKVTTVVPLTFSTTVVALVPGVPSRA